MSTQTQPKPDVLDLLAEREQAKLSFATFVKHVKIEETQGDSVGIIPFQEWPHLIELNQLLRDSKLLVLPKARQVGITWALLADSVWLVKDKPGSLVVCFSQGELEARELVRRCRIINENLPDHIRGAVKQPDSGERVEFIGGGRILALPSTKKAGRSFTATRVIFDEADYHEWLEDDLAAVKPTTDEGGQLILTSTSNFATMDSTFKRLVRRSPGNHYKMAFYGWKVRPGRDQSWYDAKRTEATDIARFEKENPGTLEQALAAPQSIRAFDVEALDRMRVDPLKWQEQTGPVTVWRKSLVGLRYVAFTDTSHGVGADYFVTCIMDVEGGRVVADVFSNEIPIEEATELSAKLLEKYGNPLWAIEDNDAGVLTLAVAKRLNYPNLYHRDNDPKKPEGYHTDNNTRPVLWGELQEAVKQGHVHVSNEKGLLQFYDVIKNVDKNGRIEAITGGHDDYPFTVGGCWQMRKHAHFGDSGKVVVVASRWGRRS